MIGLIFVIAIFGCILYWIRQSYKFWSDRGFLNPPISFPFGSLKNLGPKILFFLLFDEYYKKYKGKVAAVGLYFLFLPTLMILDIELVKDVFIREFSSFRDRGLYYNKEDDPLSANLSTLDGQDWKERRSILSPAFTMGKMKMMFDIVVSIGDRLVGAIDKEISKSPIMEVREILTKFTTDVISNVAFGLDSKCLEDPNSEFVKQGQRITNLTTLEFMRLLLQASYPNFARKLKMPAIPREASDFLHGIFTQTIKEREKTNIERNDFVQLLMKLREKKSLTFDEMAAESFIFFLAGFETSASTITFTFYELALNSDIQERLRSEIQEGLDNNGGQVDYDLLFSLPYLEMVVKETLRKYPIIPAMLRKCNKEYPIPGTDLVIPKGINVLLPIYSIHHDPEYYPSPDIFDPERFSPENSESRNPITFLPFGEGPRNCIGSRFGYLQIKLALVKLLTNFKFSVTDKTPIPMKFKTTTPFLLPLDDMWLDVQRL